MMKRFQLLVLTVLAVTTFSSSTFAQEKQAGPNEAEAKAVAASLTPAEQEAARLLLYSAALSAQLGGLVDIPRDIQERYNTAAKTVGFSVPGTAVAVGTLYTFQSSLKEFKSVMQWVNVVIGYVGRSFNEVGRLTLQSLEAIGVKFLSEKLFESSERTFNALILPVLKISSNRGIGYALATSGGVGSLAGSSYLTFNGPADALKYDVARNLFGYNKHLSEQIDEKVAELGYVFALKPSDITSVKDAVRIAVIENAVKNDFRKEATYELDLVQVLESKNAIGADQIAAAKLLREIVKHSTAVKVDEDDQARLGRSVTVILATQALLDTMIESGKLSTSSEKEARQMLGNSKRVVKRIHENLVQH